MIPPAMFEWKSSCRTFTVPCLWKQRLWSGKALQWLIWQLKCACRIKTCKACQQSSLGRLHAFCVHGVGECDCESRMQRTLPARCAWRRVSGANSVNCTATRVAAFKDQKGKLYWYSIQNASVTSLHHKSQCCYQVFLFFTMFFSPSRHGTRIYLYHNIHVSFSRGHTA